MRWKARRTWKSSGRDRPISKFEIRNSKLPAEQGFTPEEAAVLQPYVTNLDRSIYALKNLPEEVVAVLFAYYSRSRETLRQNLLKLIREKDLDLEGALGHAASAQPSGSASRAGSRDSPGLPASAQGDALARA